MREEGGAQPRTPHEMRVSTLQACTFPRPSKCSKSTVAAPMYLVFYYTRAAQTTLHKENAKTICVHRCAKTAHECAADLRCC